VTEKHKIMGGKVYVYRRDRSSNWQCSTFLEGRNWRVSTKEDSLSRAKEFAEDWYLGLRGKKVLGQLKHEKSFKQAADQFMKEYEVITQGQRSPIYIDNTKRRLKNYLNPFFGEKGLSEVTAGLVQEYRIYRQENSVSRYNSKGEEGKLHPYGPPSRSTLHQEIVTLRQVLKTAIRHGWLTHLPDLSIPYKTAGKITHRAWFSPEEYKQFYEATRRRAKNPTTKRWKYASEQLHDYVLFMANTGLRPDEAKRLQYRDVTIIEDEETEETILEIEVRGKRGVGYCKSMAGAVRPFQRLVERNKPQRDTLIFPKFPAGLFNAILEEENLKIDREGQRRTAYSLRHTYICLRLMEGADIYQIAKNCRTSVEMIETYYASHIKTHLNAAAINVRRPRKKKEAVEGEQSLLAE
jgi:integrase